MRSRERGSNRRQQTIRRASASRRPQRSCPRRPRRGARRRASYSSVSLGRVDGVAGGSRRRALPGSTAFGGYPLLSGCSVLSEPKLCRGAQAVARQQDDAMTVADELVRGRRRDLCVLASGSKALTFAQRPRPRLARAAPIASRQANLRFWVAGPPSGHRGLVARKLGRRAWAANSHLSRSAFELRGAKPTARLST